MPKAILKLKLCVFILLSAMFIICKADVVFNPSELNIPKVTPADEAFNLSVTQDSSKLEMKWAISSCCYLYQEKIKATLALPDGQKQSLINVNTLPRAERIEDPFFGTQFVYRNSLSIHADLNNYLAKLKAAKILLKVDYQGCAQTGFCYPPESKWYEITVNNHQITSVLPTNQSTFTKGKQETPLQNEDKQNHSLFNMLSDKGLTATLAAFYLFGILLAFTPCVLPMIPILFGIIVGQKHLNTSKAFWLSLCYVLSMALTYALAGILAATLGKNLQAQFQKPIFIILFALLFVYLGAVQLGFVRLTFPHHHRFKEFLNRIHAKQESGTYIGAAIMGVLATLISSPCVSAPMIGALSYISRSGNMLLGASALFLLGCGMGTVLLLLGTIGGKYVPKSGPWMHTMNHIFAILMFGLSLWLLERILPGPFMLILWGCLTMFIAWSMKTFRLRTGFTGHLGMLFVVYSFVLFWGAYLGESDPLKPILNNPWKIEQKLPELKFKTIGNLEQLQEFQSEANENNQGIFLVFYAKWCLSCQHLEHHVLTQPQIQKALSNWKLIQADITEYNEANQLLMRHFDIIGPPAILFLKPNGSELSKFRILGEAKADEVLKHIENARKNLD